MQIHSGTNSVEEKVCTPLNVNFYQFVTSYGADRSVSDKDNYFKRIGIRTCVNLAAA